MILNCSEDIQNKCEKGIQAHKFQNNVIECCRNKSAMYRGKSINFNVNKLLKIFFIVS